MLGLLTFQGMDGVRQCHAKIPGMIERGVPQPEQRPSAVGGGFGIWGSASGETSCTDADWGKQTYRGVAAQGKAWEKVTAWFGYKIHLLVDATDELPLAGTVTKTSPADISEAPQSLEQLKMRHPRARQAARYLMGDRGYDATQLVRRWWDKYRIKPIIRLRG